MRISYVFFKINVSINTYILIAVYNISYVCYSLAVQAFKTLILQ